MNACRTITGVFRKQFALIAHQLDADTVHRLLDRVPTMNPYVGRMVLQAVLGAEVPGIAEMFRQIAEDADSDPEIVSLAGRLQRTELRPSSLGRWPELYEIVKAA